MKRQNNRILNRRAFIEVLDSYVDMHSKSTTKIMDMSQPGGAAKNPASPSFLDFFCDVENTLKQGLETQRLRDKVTDHYIVGNEVLDKDAQAYVEQKIGKMFRERQIWPVSKYFLTIRTKRS